MHVLEEYQTKRARIEEVNQDLKGKQVCVLRGTADLTAQELQNIIGSFGGIHVANPGYIYGFIFTTFQPRSYYFTALFMNYEVLMSSVSCQGPKTLFVVTGAPKHLKSKSIIKSNKYNVVSADWLIACRNVGKVIPM